MSKKQKVVVAMSGGVDSSVAACLLHEQGYQVVGFFMRIGGSQSRDDHTRDRHRGCCSAADAADARFVAGKLGINFYALNFEKDFDKIIDYFVDEYQDGRTPNPCVMCNNQLKFGKIIDYATQIDCDLIATGHYARTGTVGNKTVLRRAVDTKKDQSYYLFGLEQDVLQRVLFPLGELTKEQVRAHAKRFELPVADKPDSVEICFVPDRDYARVVKERAPESAQPGPIVDQSGQQLGDHDGIIHYTIGQRRGLGVALGLPIYVTHINSADNTVTVGSREDLMCSGLLADRVHWMIEPPQAARRVRAQIRHQHQPAAAMLTPLESNRVRVEFDDPQSAITPGQAVVFFDEDDCLGGAWIQEPLHAMTPQE